MTSSARINLELVSRESGSQPSRRPLEKRRLAQALAKDFGLMDREATIPRERLNPSPGVRNGKRRRNRKALAVIAPEANAVTFEFSCIVAACVAPSSDISVPRVNRHQRHAVTSDVLIISSTNERDRHTSATTILDLRQCRSRSAPPRREPRCNESEHLIHDDDRSARERCSEDIKEEVRCAMYERRREDQYKDNDVSREVSHDLPRRTINAETPLRFSHNSIISPSGDGSS